MPNLGRLTVLYFTMIFLFEGLLWRGGGPEDSHGEGEQRTIWWNTLRSQKPIIVSNILVLKKVILSQKDII